MYEIALEYDPDCSDAHVGKGAAFVNQKEHEKGIREFEKALVIQPTHKNAKIYLEATKRKLQETQDAQKLKVLEDQVVKKKTTNWKRFRNEKKEKRNKPFYKARVAKGSFM